MKLRRRLKAGVFTVLGINVAALLMVLAQGCRQEGLPPASVLASTNSPVPSETVNSFSVSTNQSALNAPRAQLEQTNSPVAGTMEYTMVKGDTFTTLAKKFHVPLKAIVEANPGVNPGRLQAGQRIRIPSQQQLR